MAHPTNERYSPIGASVVAARPGSAPGDYASTIATLPDSLRRALSPSSSAADAEEFARELAHTHYENFSVVSRLLPRRLRQDFCNVYAFCRTADDLGDELGDSELSTKLLADLRESTRRCFDGEATNLLFAALEQTVRRHQIPIQPFLDLIDAFAQDQRVRRYETFEDLRDYCRRSADPVGRIVLYMCGYRDAQRQAYSDATCTALQLANFWQDVRRDFDNLDRVYIPLESMRRFGVSEAQLADGRCDENYRALIRFEIDRTAALFDQGDALLPLLDASVRSHVALFAKGGRAILRAIRDRNYDTLSSRPALSGWQKGRLLMSAVRARFAPRMTFHHALLRRASA